MPGDFWWECGRGQAASLFEAGGIKISISRKEQSLSGTEALRSAGSNPIDFPIAKGSRPRILVVDDEVEVVKALTMRLEFAGYEIYSAFDGASACQMALQTDPDLIILDIGMPRGDGHAVARGLTDHLDAPLIPIIFLTARTSRTDHAKAKSVGASAYITKPYTSQHLLETVACSFAWKKAANN